MRKSDTGSTIKPERETLNCDEATCLLGKSLEKERGKGRGKKKDVEIVVTEKVKKKKERTKRRRSAIRTKEKEISKGDVKEKKNEKPNEEPNEQNTHEKKTNEKHRHKLPTSHSLLHAYPHLRLPIPVAFESDDKHQSHRRASVPHSSPTSQQHSSRRLSHGFQEHQKVNTGERKKELTKTVVSEG
jgi:hypothetical protein